MSKYFHIFYDEMVEFQKGFSTTRISSTSLILKKIRSSSMVILQRNVEIVNLETIFTVESI